LSLLSSLSEKGYVIWTLGFCVQEAILFGCWPIFFFSLLCWEYVLAFTKVLKIYHTWLRPLPPFLEYFHEVSFFHLHTCVHIGHSFWLLGHSFLWISFKMPRYLSLCFNYKCREWTRFIFKFFGAIPYLFCFLVT
jgi:hypothetical protein